MAKASAALSNFTGGELSPRLDGRTDLSKYFNGCKKLQNFVIHPHGGASRRPGTIHIAEVKNSAHGCRLIPFEFNVTQAYILEFGDEYFRVYKDGGQIVDGGSAVEVATPYDHTELSELKFTQSADVMYIVHPSYAPRKITRTSHTAWSISEVDFTRGPMQDPNTTTTTLTASARTGSVTITASASTFASSDVGRLVKLHDGYAKITAYSSATSVTATVQDNEDGVAELAPSYTATTIAFHEGDPSTTGLEHNDRITDSAANFVDQGFKANTKVTISGASNGGNNKSTAVLIVQVTADTILFSPSVDFVAESASQSVTINGALTADNNFSLGAFSTTTGFPAATAFFEQRLVFANTATQPQTIFFSVGGDFENFTAGTDNDDALTYTIGSNQVNVIRYLSSGRSLIVGTSGGEFAVTASGSSEPLTPTNAQIKRQASYGSADIQPVSVGNVTLFVQRARRKLRELVYDYNSDSYLAPDLTLLAEHITASGIKEISYMQEPDNIVWCVLNNGKLAGMTYRREEQVVAWHEHIIGGVSGSATVTVSDYANIATGATLKITKSDGETITFTCQGAGSSTPDTNKFFHNESNNTTADNIYTAINAHDDFTVANPAAAVVTIEETQRAGNGFLTIVSSDTTRLAVTDQSYALVESISTIPGAIDEDSLYMVVQRTINGATKRYVEYLNFFNFGDNVLDAYFVDSGLSYSGSSTSSLSGLSHLEGEPVTIVTNGSTHPRKSVSSSAITLDRATTSAYVGLGYTSTLQTMRLDAGGQEGTSQGKTKRIHDITLRLFRTIGSKIGSSETLVDLIPFRSSADQMDQALDLFTGDKEVEFRGGYDNDGFVVVVQDDAMPLTVLAIFPRLQTFDQ
tara:strand:+ start:4901 stop:7492 length:2592 start_codon:yes stop_codon:yes gene_type:complete